MRTTMRLNKTIVLIIISGVLMLSGCGVKLEPDSSPDVSSRVSVSDYFNNTEGKSSVDFYYDVSSHILEYDLPPIDGEWIDAEIEAYNYYVPTGDVIGQYGEYFYIHRAAKQIGGRITLLCDICGKEVNEFIDLAGDFQTVNNPYRCLFGSVITTIDEDGKTEYFVIKLNDWGENRYAAVRDVIGIDEEENIILELQCLSDLYGVYVGEYSKDGSSSIIGKIPDANPTMLGGKALCYDSGSILYYNSVIEDNYVSNTKTIYMACGGDMGEKEFSYNDFYVKGYCRMDAGDSLYYGVDDEDRFYFCESFGEASEKSGILTNLYTDPKEVILTAGITDDREIIYVTNGEMLWTLMGDKSVSEFLADNYILADRIYGIIAKKDGFTLLATYDGQDVLYTAKLMKGKKTEKKSSGMLRLIKIRSWRSLSLTTT